MYNRISLKHTNNVIEEERSEERNEKILKYTAIIALLVQLNPTILYMHTAGTFFGLVFGIIPFMILLWITILHIFIPLTSLFKFEIEYKKIMIFLNLIIIALTLFRLFEKWLNYTPVFID